MVHERLRTGDASARGDCGDRRRARLDDEERRRGERQRGRDQERVRERVARRGDEGLLDPVEHRVEARALRRLDRRPRVARVGTNARERPARVHRGDELRGERDLLARTDRSREHDADALELRALDRLVEVVVDHRRERDEREVMPRWRTARFSARAS